MSNYIFTGLDDRYWDRFGASWIYTLREVAKYQGKIVIFDYGLSGLAKKKIAEKEAVVIQSEKKEDIRFETIKQICKYAKTNKGKFVYWDADIFFEENVDELFEIVEDKILLAENKNPGFIAGPHYQWAFIEDIIGFMDMAKQKANPSLVTECLEDHFEKLIKYVDNTWNFIGLDFKTKHKAIHPAGGLKPLMIGKGLLFHDRKDIGYLKFVENKTVTLRRLIKKGV